MQVFVVFSLIVVLWCVYGYSLAFTEGNAYIGGFDRLFLNGTFDAIKGEFSMGATFSKGTPMYELVFVAFQATFAAITCCADPGRRRRAHEVLGRADLHGHLVHLLLRAHRAHGVVLDGAGCLHGREPRRRAERQGGAPLAVGRARLRGRHGGAHQRRRGGPRGRLPPGQARGLRQGEVHPAQPAHDHDRRVAAVVRLVRLQRRLRARGERLGRASRS